MSLVGNLEDLGLGDILQIVSLSRKSGVLSLRNRGREGRIVFLRGQVIQATSSVSRDTLGDLLLRKGLVSPDSLRKALHQQRQTLPPVRLGTILCEQFGLSRQAVEAVLREQVENIVYSFFGWTEGVFTFDLGEPEDFPATFFDPLQFMLDQGLNPQWLVSEGGRKDDERRDAGEGGRAQGAPLPAGDHRSPGLDESPSGLDPRGKVHDPDSLKPNFNLGAELSRELDEAPGDGVAVNAVASPGLHLLKGMLLELNNPSLGGGIILLVLRFASEFMNRAVIFGVKEKEIVGLGQFGIEVFEGNPDARVRSMRIPVEEDSPFTAVLERGIPAKVRPEQGKWDMYLQEALGGGVPEEIFLGPLISEGKIVAILYGDNLPRNNSVGDTEPLEIFLSQAGMVMEKVLLERRLHEISVT